MNTFTIYANQLDDVKKRLDRLAKKAARYSIPFSYAVGNERPETVRVYEIDHVNGVQYETERHTVAAVTVNVECDKLSRQTAGRSERALSTAKTEIL